MDIVSLCLFARAFDKKPLKIYIHCNLRFFYRTMSTQFLVSKPVFSSEKSSNTQAALSQWHTFCETLEALECTTQLMPPIEHDLHSMPMATLGFIDNDTITLGYHDTDELQCAPYLAAWLSEQVFFDKKTQRWPQAHADHKRPHFFYGSADVLSTTDTLYFGYSQHGSAHANCNQLAAAGGRRLIDLALKKPSRYLIDSVLLINEGQILYQPETLHSTSLGQLTQDFSVICTADPIETLPTHTLIIGHQAICADTCFETQQCLSSLGYKVHALPFDALLAFGLGPRALVLPC
jgi:N-dimethylarginine dimethylaminohydrolase